MAYQIDLKKIREYIRYLEKFKKDLEKDLAIFESDLKKAHEFWDDERYTNTVEAKNKIVKELKNLIDSTKRAIKNLNEMHDLYQIYLRRK